MSSMAVGNTDAHSAALTRARKELKYLVPRASFDALSQALAAHLPVHMLRAWGDSSPPSPTQAITTVYFDSADRDLFRLADGSDRNIKLRVREYDAVHPDVRDLGAREGVIFDEIVWLELKRKDGDKTDKRRSPIPKPDVAAFVAQGARTREMELLARDVPEAESALQDISAFVVGFGKPLEPACVVNYVRCAWQADDGSARVTVDRDVAFFPPSRQQFRRQDLTERSSLGPPVGAEPSCVVEVKTHGELPAWLSRALDSAGAQRVDYSKFVSAMVALYGR